MGRTWQGARWEEMWRLDRTSVPEWQPGKGRGMIHTPREVQLPLRNQQGWGETLRFWRVRGNTLGNLTHPLGLEKSSEA